MQYYNGFNVDTNALKAFVNAYKEAILFSESFAEGAIYEGENIEGKAFDYCLTIYDFSPEADKKIFADCIVFLEKCLHKNIDILSKGTEIIARAGHDFYFTRQGHGTGFWDNLTFYGHEGEALTSISIGIGEAYYEWDNDSECIQVNQ